MSKETILKIKEAEKTAEGIRSSAHAEAKARIKDTEVRGKHLCEQTEQRVAEENRQKLELIKAKADEMILHTRQSAQSEADASADSAGSHLREAVRYIIGGIMEECQ